jgi:hypothetical protein
MGSGPQDNIALDRFGASGCQLAVFRIQAGVERMPAWQSVASMNQDPEGRHGSTKSLLGSVSLTDPSAPTSSSSQLLLQGFALALGDRSPIEWEHIAAVALVVIVSTFPGEGHVLLKRSAQMYQ